MVDRLENCLEQGASVEELSAIIQSLKCRSGAFGEQRKELLNYLFKGIIDLSFPSYIKNLFYGCTHNMGLFEAPGNSKQELKPENEEM